MSTKTLMTIGLALLAVSILSFSPSSAWTCDGTITLPSSDADNGPGTVCGGDYTNTTASDDSYECLEETVAGDPAISHLYHAWYFEDVPAGDQYLIYEGHRVSDDGDDFKFTGIYLDSNGNHGVVPIPALKIYRGFDLQGGTMSPALVTTPLISDWYVDITDTANGSTCSTVYVDFIAICTVNMD